MLVIADAKKPVALAGVMGGMESEVSASTVDILLESAWFEPLSIRRTSKKIGLQSEASYRFGRGADYGGVEAALDRAASLIAELAGAKIGPLTDVKGRVFQETKITLPYSFIEKHLGTAPGQAEAENILKNLGFVIEKSPEGILSVRVPSWRADVVIPADIAEEVARHFGYERMEARLYPVRVNDKLLAAGDTTKRILQDELASLGLREAMNYNFALIDDLAVLHIKEEDCVLVSNPLSNDQKYLRPSLLPGLIANLRFNIDHGARDIAFFEIGKVFLPGGTGEAPLERLHLAVMLKGRADAPGWHEGSARMYDFYDAKGIAERMAISLGIEDMCFVKSAHPAWHPGRSADIVHGKKVIGRLGEMHPQGAKSLDIKERVIMMEIDIEGCRSAQGAGKKVREPSKFPHLLRDLAFVVPEELECGVLLESIRKSARHLETLTLMSIWRGGQIGAGYKSLAFSLEFVCADRTLSDEEVEKILGDIIRDLEKRHAAKLR
jgi:phenylalanyl-tRNA synthetase beta chain